MLKKEPRMGHRAGSSRVLGTRCGHWAFHHLACVCTSFCRLPWFSPGQAPEPWEIPLVWSREGVLLGPAPRLQVGQPGSTVGRLRMSPCLERGCGAGLG